MAKEKELTEKDSAVKAAGVEAREILNAFFKNISAQKQDEMQDRFFPNGIGLLYINVTNGDDVSVEIEVSDLEYAEDISDEDDDLDLSDFGDFNDSDNDEEDSEVTEDAKLEETVN